MINNKKAFTITELVIVIAVIAILAAVMIPTFGGVIESAKVGTDTANAKILTTQLELALLDSGEEVTEQNAHRLLKEEFASTQAGAFVPQSAGYGYHFVYNFNNGMIEVKHISEITKSATQSANMSNGGADVSDWGNVPETCFLQEGYFLLDTAGSALSEVVNGIYTVASTDDLTAIANAMGEKLTKDYAAAAEYINAYLDTVVFIGNGSDFTTAADRNSVKNIVFVEGVNEITSVVNTVSEGGINQSVIDYDNPVATLNDGAVVEIPASVNKISHNALVFAVTGEDKAQHNEQRITLHFEGGIDQVAQGLDIGFTNCEFTFGDSQTVYHLSDDGTQILDEANEVVETLESQYPVTDFDIRIVGVDSEDVLSVALDSFADGIGSYQFEAVNFMSGDKPFASNTSVTWEIAPSTSNGASITAEGLLTFDKAGEIVVKATSDENPEITATFTVRIGGVINTSGIEFTGIDGNLEIVDAVTSKITMINGQPAVINYSVTVNTNFEIEGIDKSYTVTSSAENAVVNQDGTISVNGAGNFTITLTFNSYPDIVVTHNFIVEEKLQSFECIAQELPNIGQYLYKVGNLNAFDITRLWQFTGLHKDEGLNDSDIEISYNIINAKDNQTLDSTWYTLEGNMLQFIDFQGVVRVEITAMADGVELNQIVVPLEVLDGYNVTSESELFNTTNNTYNKMILNDIVLTSYRSNGTYVVNGATLYGNGFTLDGSDINTENVIMFWHALVSVNDSVVDNIQVIGDTFPEIGWSNKPYAGYSLYLAGDYCEVYNSYLYGSRAPINVVADSYIYNSVFEGGALANINLECKNVTLADVTTIQNIDSDTLPDGIDETNIPVIGMGVFVGEGITDGIKITLEGDFRQYNWVDTSLVEKFDEKYRPIINNVLSNATEFKHNMGAEYINAGIIFYEKITDEELATKIVDNRTNKSQFPYSSKSYSAYLPVFGTVSGTIYSLNNNGNADTAGSNINNSSDNRFDSNAYKRLIASLQTKPIVTMVEEYIDTTLDFTLVDNKLTVQFTNEVNEFTIANSNLPIDVKYYNRDLKLSAKLVSADGTDIDSVTVSLVGTRTAVVKVKVTVSDWYDASGTLVNGTCEFFYEFELEGIAPADLRPTINLTQTDPADGYMVEDKEGCNTYYCSCLYIFRKIEIVDNGTAVSITKFDRYEIGSGNTEVTFYYSNGATLKVKFHSDLFGQGKQDQFEIIQKDGEYVLKSKNNTGGTSGSANVTYTYTNPNGYSDTKVQSFTFKFN